MVWYLGVTPVDAAYVGQNAVSGVVSTPALTPAFGFWSWWMYPQAIVSGSNTLLGFCGNEGYHYISEINNLTKEFVSFPLSTNYAIDDHNGAAMLPLSNGQLLTSYTGHNQDITLRWRKSASGRIADLGAEQSRDMANVGRTTTYCQLIESPTTPGLVWWFTRLDNDSWYVVISTDYGETFGAETEVINTDRQFYGLFRLLPGRKLIRAFLYPHPNFSQNTLRVMDIDVSSIEHGLVVSNGAPKGYLGGAAHNGAVLPLTEDQMSEVYTPAANVSIRLLDTSNGGDMVVICEFATPDGSPGTYKLGRLNGSNPHDSTHWTWTTLIAAGSPFYNASNYYPGIEFAREPHVGYRLYIIRRLAGPTGAYIHERWDSADAVTWATQEIARSTSDKILRPVTPLDASYHLPVLWGQGVWTNFTAFSMEMRTAQSTPEPTSIDDLLWEVRAVPDVIEGATAKFAISWYGAPIPEDTTCTIDIAEGGTVAAGDFSVTLDSAVATSIAALPGVSYNSASNRLSVTSAATSPVVVSRGVVSGDASEDRETWTLTISNPSHGRALENTSTSTILDPTGGALGGNTVDIALGMDRLSPIYNGPAITLRRSSDDSLKTFYHSASTGLLDTVSIAAWLGANTGYVRRLYDQSGYGNHAAQSVLAAQPIYVANATPNGRPVIRGDGTGQKLTIITNASVSNIFAGGGYFCVAARANSAGGGSLGRILSKDTAEDATATLLRWFDSTNLRFTRQFTSGARSWHSVVPTNGAAAWFVYGINYSGDVTTNLPVTRVNSADSGASAAAPTTAPTISDATGNLYILNNHGGDRGWDGDFMGLVWAQTAPGTGPEEAIEDAIIAQYGVA